MTKLNSYLNFQGNAEEAFQFYKSAFGTEFESQIRFKDIPEFPGKEKLNESDLDKIMHISLRIGDNLLMATDLLESLGQYLKTGNAVTLSLYPGSREEADKLYGALSQGGKAYSPMSEMFWGYWGMLTDKFGVQWMVNYQKT
jgi:PhnB protein